MRGGAAANTAFRPFSVIVHPAQRSMRAPCAPGSVQQSPVNVPSHTPGTQGSACLLVRFSAQCSRSSASLPAHLSACPPAGLLALRAVCPHTRAHSLVHGRLTDLALLLCRRVLPAQLCALPAPHVSKHPCGAVLGGAAAQHALCRAKLALGFPPAAQLYGLHAMHADLTMGAPMCIYVFAGACCPGAC